MSIKKNLCVAVATLVLVVFGNVLMWCFDQPDASAGIRYNRSRPACPGGVCPTPNTFSQPDFIPVDPSDDGAEEPVKVEARQRVYKSPTMKTGPVRGLIQRIRSNCKSRRVNRGGLFGCRR